MTARQRLQLLFYLLMRDHVPTGVLAGIVDGHIAPTERDGRTAVFSNAHLAAHAGELADDLMRSEGPDAAMEGAHS